MNYCGNIISFLSNFTDFRYIYSCKYQKMWLISERPMLNQSNALIKYDPEPIMRIFFLLISIVIANQSWAMASGKPETITSHKYSISNQLNVQKLHQLHVAEATDKDKKPENGELIIPGENSSSDSEKKCLTVCKNWGEDCMINPRTGASNCRKTCKEFGRECF